MAYDIDTLEFKTNDGLHLFVLNADTFPCWSENEGCLVSVKIDTVNLALVILDTGAGMSLFDVNSIKNKHIGQNINISNTWMNTVSLSEIYIDSIEFGKTTLYKPNNVPFLSHARPQNILGGDVLKHFVWKFDNKHKKIYFSQDTSAFQREDCYAIPFVLEGNRPFIECVVNGKVYDVMVDTGFSDFLHVVDRTAKNNSIFFETGERLDSFIYYTTFFDDKNCISFSGMNFDTVKFCRTISDVKINSLSFENEIVMHNTFSLNMIGWDFFQRFDYVIMDYINQVMYLGSANENKSMAYAHNLRSYINATGIMGSLMDPFIISILKDSLIEKGISLGDTIIALNGGPVSELELRKSVHFRDSLKITVKNANSQRDFTLNRNQFISEPDTVMSYGEMLKIMIYEKIQVNRPDSGVCIIKYVK